MTEPDADTAFAALHGHKYARLTTFRKNGEGVASAMWFALEGGQLYIATPANTGKVKRLRNDPRALIAPSNASGVARGAEVGVRAHILPVTEHARARTALKRKYGFLARFTHLMARLRRTTVTYIRVVSAA